MTASVSMATAATSAVSPVDEWFLDHQRELELVYQQDLLMSALITCETVDYETLDDEIQSTFPRLEKKNPVMILMEYGQCTRSAVNLVEVGQPSGPPHMPRFTMAAVVNGRPYARVRAGCKKFSRFGAAYLAWRALIREEQARIEECLLKSDNSFDKLATLSHLEYMRQVERNPCAYCGRKVLAAIVLRDNEEIGKVVGIGTGNRTIGSANLSLDGTTVNDSHAEVIARRSFLRFIYRQLRAYKENEDTNIYENPKSSIFEKSPSGKLRLRSNVSFHMYISNAPCGDSVLFTRLDHINNKDNTAIREPIFTSKCQSLLRAKIDAGQGTIPVEPNFTQTWISLQFGKRLHTMSCTDKVTKWNILGIQGALLSQFIDPIYLDTISIGDNFVYGHVVRALYYRLSKTNSEPSLTLPPGYQAVLPELGEGKFEISVADTEKSKCYSVNWSNGEEKAEVIDGTNGKVVEGTNGDVSRICKLSIYDEYRSVAELFQRDDLVAAETYHHAKQAAVEYQHAKEILFSKFEELEYGQWVKKPVEVDYFS